VPEPASFDSVARRYDADLDRGLALTGEGKDYFAEGRVRHLFRALERRGVRPERILDYGCGNGDTLPLLARAFGGAEVAGFEPSRGLLEEARTRHSGHRFFDSAESPSGVSLAYANGVLHHVAPAERLTFLGRVRGALAAGGHLALFENNPLNPGTRLVMRRIPFDRDAVPVMPWEASRLLRAAGFEIRARDFLFFFPAFLRALRPLEGRLSALPLGGQYMILARAPVADQHADGTLPKRI
jgi:SAM-dependent methyltransferase